MGIKYTDNYQKLSDSNSGAWEVLYRCFPRLRQKLGANSTSDVSNGITLQRAVPEEFGKFYIAFQLLPSRVT